jgi:hypothetical protein
VFFVSGLQVQTAKPAPTATLVYNSLQEISKLAGAKIERQNEPSLTGGLP